VISYKIGKGARRRRTGSFRKLYEIKFITIGKRGAPAPSLFNCELYEVIFHKIGKGAQRRRTESFRKLIRNDSSQLREGRTGAEPISIVNCTM
jgi:hypothetical protein